MSDDGAWPELMTVREVADRYRVSKMTVYRLVHDGAIKATMAGRKHIRVYGESARQYLKDQQIAP